MTKMCHAGWRGARRHSVRDRFLKSWWLRLNEMMGLAIQPSSAQMRSQLCTRSSDTGARAAILLQTRPTGATVAGCKSLLRCFTDTLCADAYPLAIAHASDAKYTRSCWTATCHGTWKVEVPCLLEPEHHWRRCCGQHGPSACQAGRINGDGASSGLCNNLSKRHGRSADQPFCKT